MINISTADTLNAVESIIYGEDLANVDTVGFGPNLKYTIYNKIYKYKGRYFKAYKYLENPDGILIPDLEHFKELKLANLSTLNNRLHFPDTSLQRNDESGPVRLTYKNANYDDIYVDVEEYDYIPNITQRSVPETGDADDTNYKKRKVFRDKSSISYEESNKEDIKVLYDPIKDKNNGVEFDPHKHVIKDMDYLIDLDPNSRVDPNKEVNIVKIRKYRREKRKGKRNKEEYYSPPVIVHILFFPFSLFMGGTTTVEEDYEYEVDVPYFVFEYRRPDNTVIKTLTEEEFLKSGDSVTGLPINERKKIVLK